MLALSLFYLLFLILLIVLLFIIILYSGFHSRTLVPPLLNTYYGLTAENGDAITKNKFHRLYLVDGSDDYNNVSSSLSGSLDFGGDGVTYQTFGFRPMSDDSQRELNGTLTILANKSSDDVSAIKLRLRDLGDDTIVADATDFSVNTFSKGLTEIKLYFKTKQLDNKNYHNLVLEGQGLDKSIPTNNFLINSAYLYYY